MKVLYIGGTGEISYACVLESVKLGQQVTVLNRSRTDQPLPPGVRQLSGDLESAAAYASVQGESFDSVCQFVAFDEARIDHDLQTFSGRVGQYVFISTASAYAKPIERFERITERTPLQNPSPTLPGPLPACSPTRARRGLSHHGRKRPHLGRDLEGMARALGVEPHLVHVASDTLVRHEPAWRGPLHGDKAPSTLFDNSKVMSVAGPFPTTVSLTDGFAQAAPEVLKRLERGAGKDDALDAKIERVLSEQGA
jgi:hypothetical protein